MLTARISTRSADPVFDLNFPDPCVLRAGDGYYAYASNSALGDCIFGAVTGSNVQVATSPDLRRWALLADTDALPQLPPWAVRGATWAPHVVAFDGVYYLYFAARHAGHGDLALGVATATDPAGPFTPVAAPLRDDPDAGGVIDPYVFADADGTRWLLWKTDGNSRGLPTWIYIQRLAADGLTLTGPAFPLIRNDQPWEGAIVEAPTLWERDGLYHLFYSASACTDHRYSIGYAVAESRLGPFVKTPLPVLASDDLRIGPGGQDVVEIDGRTWLLSHGWDPALGYRRLYLDELCWVDTDSLTPQPGVTRALNGPRGGTRPLVRRERRAAARSYAAVA